MPVYYLNFNRPVKGLYNISPMTVGEWIALFKNADTVFSASYHGLVFSLYFQKKLFYYNRGNKARMKSFGEELRIQHREGTDENLKNAIIPIAMPTPIVAKKNIEKLSKEKKKVLFVGSKYYPNIIGIRWFYKEVLPQLGYDFELKIVGRGTEFLAEEFNDERVKVVGTVDSVEPFYQDADIVIAPLFDGGGMKCKTVEAVGYGKYLVGTTESLQGFNDN